LIAAAAAAALVPGSATACPVCFASSQAGVLKAYYLSAGILTALPFLVIGGIIYSVSRLRRRRANPAITPGADLPPLL
jgi:cyanate permease